MALSALAGRLDICPYHGEALFRYDTVPGTNLALFMCPSCYQETIQKGRDT
jgi:hypothetical protein